MRFFVVGFTFLAVASAGFVSASDYLPPVQELAQPTSEYLPPTVAGVAEPTLLADDGYRYKTVKKLRLRHRRDVNEISNEYLPPVEEGQVQIPAPALESAPVLNSAVLSDDGYRYRTVKRYRLRRRRDVNELSNEYLPPLEIAPPVAEVAPVQDSSVLSNNGYRYRTVKRYRHRRRRDVNEISNEYLPPVEEAQVEVSAPFEQSAPAVLADDGYRYRTVKRYRLRRRRRDVNEISNEYLPPVEEAQVEVSAPIVQSVPAQDSAVLADDGYRYRTVKRYRLRRRRRDVNEISNEYLPQVEEAQVEVSAPIVQSVPAQDSAVLADDGYRYRTVKRYRLRRRRRDVNEISNEYLPPVEEAQVEVSAPIVQSVPAQDSAVLADDGYRYRTVKRYRLRRRRDVNEISNEYLPPVEEAQVQNSTPFVEVAPAQETALASDGYRYKTIRRLRFRYRH